MTPDRLSARLAVLAGAASAVIGALSLAYRATGIRFLPTWPPGAPSMALWVSAAVLLSGLALIATMLSPRFPALRPVAQALAVAVIAASLLTIVATVTGWPVDLEHLVASALPRRLPEPAINPIAPAILACGGIGLLCLATGRARTLAAALGVFVLLMGLAVCLGFVFGGPVFQAPALQRISLAGGVAAVLGGLGVLTGAGPAAWPLRMMSGESVRAVLMRWFVPYVALAVLATGAATFGFFAGLSPALRVMLDSLASVAVAALVVFYLARTLGGRIEQAEERFTKVFMSAPAGIAISDTADGRLRDVNEEFARIFGYTREELIGRTSAELGLWQDPADRERVVSIAAATGANRDVKLRMRSRTGQLLTLRSSFSLSEMDGKPVLLSAFTDVTARESSEARFQAIVETSHDGILFTDAKGMILYRSPSYRQINGYADDERMGHSGFDTLHPDDAAGVRAVWEEMLRRPDEIQHLQYRIRHKDGRWVSVDTSVQNLLGDPHVGAVLVTTRDVSERLHAEAERGRIAQEYRELVESARDVIFTLTPDGILTSVNPAFEAVAGVPPEQVLGRPFAALLHPDDVALASARLSAAVAGDPPGPVVPLRIRRPDGSYRIGEIHVVPRRHDGRVVSVFGIGRDVSERVHLEQELLQAQKMEAIGRLAGGIAHDFNNLLTVIVGSGQLALQDLKPESPEREEVEEIVKAAQRAAELTRQLLAFSRRQVLEPRTLDLNAVLANIEKLLRRVIGEDVTLLTVPAPSVGLVRADPSQLEQVITNLAVNARDAMPAGGTLTLSTANVTLDEAFTASHPGARPGPHVLLSVRDTGVGMTEDVKARAFEPFFTTKEVGKGTGLGLATVYGIVAQSGGLITVDSAPGRGSRFDIYLPAILAAQGTAAAGQPLESALRGSETVLVVEDNAAVKKLVVRVLDGYGYRVLSADSGDAGLELARREREPIHLLVADVVMPGISGRTLSQQLLAARPALKVLYISGYTDDAVSREGVLEPGTVLLQKPFSPLALAQKVRDILDGRPEQAPVGA